MENQNQTSFRLKETFCTVTPLSKFVAALLFIALPFIGFWIGLKYDNYVPQNANSDSVTRIINLESGSLPQNFASSSNNEYIVQNQEVVDSDLLTKIKNWEEFRHATYKLSFKCPQDMNVRSNEIGFEPVDAASFYVSVNREKSVLNIDPSPVPGSNKAGNWMNPKQYDPKDVEKWDLKRTAEEIWQMNKEDSNQSIFNHTVSNLEETLIGGRKAYAFSVTGSYIDFQEGSLVEKGMTYIFASNNDDVFLKISHPSSNNVSEMILKTIQFQ